MNNNAEKKRETYRCNCENKIKKILPKITGIMPAYNLFKAHYPFLECIISAMPLVDEFVFQDGGSTDGTLDAVKKLAKFYPIRIIEIPHYKGDNWESMDRALELAFSQIDNKWIIEIQADEYYLQKDYQEILEEIKVANEQGCNGIRQRRIDLSWTSSSDYVYKIIRIFRNIPNIKSEWGGDHFYFEDGDKKPRESFTTHNLPPELDSNINMYHLSRAMPKTALMKGITHSEFYAINHSNRKQVLEREKERVKKRPEFLTRKFHVNEINPNIPELFYGLLDLVDYQARSKLFDYEWLRLQGYGRKDDK